MLAVVWVLGYVRLNFTEASSGCVAGIRAVRTRIIWLNYALPLGRALLGQENPVKADGEVIERRAARYALRTLLQGSTGAVSG